MKLENRIFNGIEYTLVDIYDWKEDATIYHFAGDESDLFCQKDEKGYYHPIRNEKMINEIIEIYLLKEPKFYFRVILPAQMVRLIGIRQLKKVSNEQRNKILNEQIQKLSELEYGVDRNILKKRLKSVNIYVADWDLSNITLPSCIIISRFPYSTA